MKEIIRFVKRLLGIYETGYEYWVNLKDIKVPYFYRKTKIGTVKWNHKMSYWLRTGEFESPIILHRDFSLMDGYLQIPV